MALFNVQANGNAPAGLSPGDIVNTAGGAYQITTPGAIGASYNPSSGYWSTKQGSLYDTLFSASELASQNAKENSMLSQQFAREQMAFQREMSSKAMSFSAEQAKINREFQKMMSDTSYQRVVKDLISAGLNPVLGVNNGASTPSGSSASGVSASGASGNVDVSNNNFISNVLGSLLNQQTQLKTSQLAAATQLETANINAKTARDVANINNSWQEYFYENYPQNYMGALAAVGQFIGDMISGNPNPGNNVGKTVVDVFEEFEEEVNELTDNGEGGLPLLQILRDPYAFGKSLHGKAKAKFEAWLIKNGLSLDDLKVK